MGIKYLLLFVVMLPCVTPLSYQQTTEEWTTFKMKFNRTFKSPEEEEYRYSVFVKNLKKIFLHNIEADKGRYSWWMGVNNFADMTDSEFEEQYTNLRLGPKAKLTYEGTNEQSSYNLTALPKEIDWRNKNCVTKVKNQGTCGSCYAFAATGALEGHTCIKTGKLVSLSEQNLLDCTTNDNYSNYGCSGGQPDHAYQYVIDHNGIDTEESYPYSGEVGKCKFTVTNVGATAKRIIEVLPRENERVLQKVVAFVGPVSVCIDSRGMKQYGHGIYYGKDTQVKLNHAMLVIGYGTDQNGQDYWILKNSYDVTWGMKGYMYLVRNQRNRCGIASLASYPVV